MKTTKLGLADKNGLELNQDDILFNGNDYYRIYISKSIPSLGQVEMISCTKGYLHDIKQDDLKEFEYVGNIETHKHLLECD